jgi:hypothetical protein
MYYSEFEMIIKEIMAMDADVFTFEAARFDLSILNALKANSFRMETGTGAYDIISPHTGKHCYLGDFMSVSVTSHIRLSGYYIGGNL